MIATVANCGDADGDAHHCPTVAATFAYGSVAIPMLTGSFVTAAEAKAQLLNLRWIDYEQKPNS